MKIAICDDDDVDLKLIQSYCSRYDSDIPVAAFTNGEALRKAYDTDFYDLVFLDIEMEPLDGLELGAQLVRLSPKPIIVFTTQSLNYAVRGYGIAMRYLPKPITYDTFYSVMSLAVEQILPQKISVFSNGVQTFISINEILYFEILQHQLFIHLNGGANICMRGTLSEAISWVPHNVFVQPHKSYYINMEYIDRFDQQTITMINGDIIPVGRSRKGLFQHKLSEYMKGKHMYEHMD